MAEQLTAADDIRELVRERYAEAANVASTGNASCCGPSETSCGCGTGTLSAEERDSFGPELYSREERRVLPDAAKLASLGCGNPTAIAELVPGETVLDLGSGGGIDVLLSARRVRPTGKAYGLGRRDHLQLRHQPLGRQDPRFPRGSPRASAGRPLRGDRHRRRPGHGCADESRHGAVDRMRRGRSHGAAVPLGPGRGGLRGDRDPRDPPGSRSGRLGDRAGPQAVVTTDLPIAQCRLDHAADPRQDPALDGLGQALGAHR
jgi:hypothetical protein